MSINPTAADIMTERLCASMKREEHLQQRLTAADERADVLEQALSKIKLRCDGYIEAEMHMPFYSVEACQEIAGRYAKASSPRR